MQPDSVVKRFNIIKNTKPCLCSGFVSFVINQFGFKCSEKRLHTGVVPTITFPAHTLLRNRKKRSILRYFLLAYCTPLSEWHKTPLGGLALPMACFKALITSCCVIVLSIAQPTILPLYRSITAARYSQPSSVCTYVISVTQALKGASTLN